MFTTIEEFEQAWKNQVEGTRKIMSALTQESLEQRVADDHRTLGRMAWHIVTTIPEMMSKTGLTVKSIGPDSPLPKTVAEIQKGYEKVTSELLQQVKSNWKDEDLQVEDDMYGQRFTRGFTLSSLIIHEVHHRGQMTVLMRQAGLKVPGLYGPSKEEWSQYGMEEPAI
jgi:uncharacterized damage-inducible protein DinB